MSFLSYRTACSETKRRGQQQQPTKEQGITATGQGQDIERQEVIDRFRCQNFRFCVQQTGDFMTVSLSRYILTRLWLPLVKTSLLRLRFQLSILPCTGTKRVYIFIKVYLYQCCGAAQLLTALAPGIHSFLFTFNKFVSLR